MLRSRSGMALILTLMAVSFMVAITVQLFSTVNWQIQAAVNLSDSVRLDAMNRSGLNLVRAALRADQEENKFDTLHDDWNSLDGENMSSLFGGGRLEVSVTDLSGRLQVNALVSTDPNPQARIDYEQKQEALWTRFLMSGEFGIDDQEKAVALIRSIQDWIDKDDNERDKGAEGGYYLSQDPPYSIRNGSLVYLEELLLIQGMTSALFYGNEEHAGIAEYLTVTGNDGKININSAPEQVLLALHEELDTEMVQALIEFRADEENRETLASSEWYRLVSGVSGDIVIDNAFLTVESRFFKVSSIARINDISRTGIALLERESGGAQKMLRWEVR